ncbi:MFS general substrate transporter [Desarmillaria tabescens]|uniref:MFS general substrate transporter n=1 Tax=Armillaria tabescens TaxID=1929756 RepID=A0AA39KG82_ARMTA|nr:MFS general substrate transporter [Desarmillaria tabescens]KAK0459375.1 MFS general substrate transporter [Desarmillaria tabescens]
MAAVEETKSQTGSESSIEQKVETTQTPESKAEPEVAGVARIEALYRVFGGKGAPLWILYLSIALIAYVYSLDSNTTSSFLPFATSAFDSHASIGTISVAADIIGAVGKPFIAKIADITSRPRAYVFSLCFYILGYIVIASSSTVGAVCAGEVLYTIGRTGLDLVTDIVVADLSPLKWRGFATALPSSPYIINAFVAAEITNGFLPGKWRWGYGIFIIMLPVVMAPALAVLFWAEIKAKRDGTVSIASSAWERRHEGSDEKVTLVHLLLGISADHVDMIGLVILGGWKNPSMIAMIVVGGVLLFVFAAYEKWFARYPLMPARVLNRTFIGAVTVDVLYMLSGSMRSLYYSSWTWVVTDWTTREWTYFNKTLTVGLCVFGIVGGLIQRYTHRYKALQFSGLCIRIIGMGLTFYARGDNATDVALVWTQLLIAIGGAFSVVGSRVASQASVPHADLAQVISLISLWTSLGGSVGYAIAAAVWTGKMPGYLHKHLPNKTDAEIAKIFGSIKSARNLGAADRTNVIYAYNDTVYLLYLPALILSFLPLIVLLFMRNFYLGDNQNAVQNVGIDGRTLENNQAEERKEEDAEKAPAK